MYQKTTLGNGLRLATSNMPHTRSVSMSFFIGAGSRYETDEQAGISHFIEHLCFKGTPRRPAATDVSVAIEGLGGILNGGTDKELTVYWCKVARPHLVSALDVLVDMLLNSRFDPSDIEKERQVVIEEIHMSMDSPSQRVDMLIDQLLWPGHPLGRDVAGTAQSVTGISRGMMLDYLAAHYQPANAVLAMAGDIRHEEAVELVSRMTEGWSGAQRPAFEAYQPAVPRRLLVENRDIEQVQLCLGMPGLPLNHPDRYRLDLLNVILGEGMSSRLFAEIRDRLGLAYNIQSYVEHFLDSGSIIVSAGVDVRNLSVAVRAILEELSRLREATPDAELSKAKEMCKGRLLLRLEDSRSVAGWMGGQEILTGRILTVDEAIAIIDAITSEELQRVAADMLSGDQLRLAAVGPVPPDEPLEDLLRL